MTDTTVQYIYKKNGKGIRDVSDTVSADGKTLTRKVRDHSPAGNQVTETDVTLMRVGAAPAGANATSGSWRIEKAKASENGLLSTFKGNREELTYSDPTGETWTAKVDGKDFPVKGSYSAESVALRVVENRKIEAIFKREGKVTQVWVMTVSPDGKKMTTVVENKLTGAVSTLVAEKQ